MKIAVFNTKPYDKESLTEANISTGFDIHFFDTRLTPETKEVAKGFEIVNVFVNDVLNREVLTTLKENGTQLITLRCAGFNNVDLVAAHELALPVLRVPAYSPHSVAEHTIALILTLSRNIHKAYNRVRTGNFSLQGLMGSELHNTTVGIVGTGTIGYLVARILIGFGCHVYAYDIEPNNECLDLGIEYCDLTTLFKRSDIVSLHCPLNTDTHHMINEQTFKLMKPGVMLINTGRGALIDAKAAIGAIKSGQLSSLGIDVYEQEEDLFFEDLSSEIIGDDVFERLLSFPNVLVTAHQGFFTQTAVKNIAQTTIQNIFAFVNGAPLKNKVGKEKVFSHANARVASILEPAKISSVVT